VSICSETQQNKVKAGERPPLEFEEVGEFLLVLYRCDLRRLQLTLDTVLVCLRYSERDNQVLSSKSKVAAEVIGWYASFVSPE
jgi:hypothetical protein